MFYVILAFYSKLVDKWSEGIWPRKDLGAKKPQLDDKNRQKAYISKLKYH